MNPKYPVYIISKGRWDSRLTSKSLEEMKVPYHIVVEPQEYDKYAKVINPNKILVLPFSNLGQGSIPARNWVWEHSIRMGASRHWILDDNLRNFFRWHKNLIVRVDSGTIFKAAEDFTDRYKNVRISGFHYFMFAPRRVKKAAFYKNTRVYSCILIDNTVTHRWRGRYNEDTDLCLRILKDGDCSILFNAFLCGKETTMTMSGGNTEDLYEIEKGRLLMAQSLVDQHPDIVRVSWKWGRYQHHVDYSGFKNNFLVYRDDFVKPVGQNEYGLKLINIEKD